MKKSLLLGILGLGAVTMSSRGQGIILLQNDEIAGAPYVLYGNNVPANGVSGALGTPGASISSTGFTAGFYWAAGTVPVPTDPTGIADPSTLNPLLILATGLGSTSSIAGASVAGDPGSYLATAAFVTPGVAAGGTITMETIAYNTGAGSYVNASYRGHSDAYQVVVGDPTGAPTSTGPTSLPISVNVVPEPSALALSGIGAAALMLTRKKKA